jgi:protein gp37
VWNELAEKGKFVQCSKCGTREFRKADIFCSTHGCVSFPECDNNRARPRVFCSSLADWLDNEIDIEWFVDLMDLIRQTPNIDWLLLTKRIGNFHSRIEQATRCANVYQKGEALFNWLKQWDWCPPENVWMGITVIDQDEADRDIPKLLETPAKLRFLSIEPMLGPVDLTEIKRTQTPGYFGDCLQWYHRPFSERDTKWNGIDWVIAGGESGRNARPIHPEWIRSLRDQCIKASVPFLFKQWGEWAPNYFLLVDGSRDESTMWMDSKSHSLNPVSACRQI